MFSVIFKTRDRKYILISYCVKYGELNNW